MVYRKSFLFRIAFACESHVYQNIPQRAPLRLPFGNVRPARQLIPLLSICFAHWVANDNPWSMQQRKRLVAGSLGRGPCGLSLAQWHSWERWPRGQLTWRRWPRWGHFFTTPQRWEPCSHRTAPRHCCVPGTAVSQVETACDSHLLLSQMVLLHVEFCKENQHFELEMVNSCC